MILITYKRPLSPVMNPRPVMESDGHDFPPCGDFECTGCTECTEARDPLEGLEGVAHPSPFAAAVVEAMLEVGPTESIASTFAAGPFEDSESVNDALRQLRSEGATELRTWQVAVDDFSPGGRTVEPPDGDRVRYERDRHYGVPGVRIRFPYNADVVARMKAEIPRGHREYRSDDKSWWISARFSPVFRQILADEWGADLDSPQDSPEVLQALRVLARHGIEATGSGELLILKPDAVETLDDMIRRNHRARW